MFNEMDSLESDGTITFEEWIQARQQHRSTVRLGSVPSMDMSFQNLTCSYEQKASPPKQVRCEMGGLGGLCLLRYLSFRGVCAIHYLRYGMDIII